MLTTKVENMRNPRTGNKVANQYIIKDGRTSYFQSYDSVISKMEIAPSVEGESYTTQKIITLDDGSSGFGWDYSATTLKYLKKFLRDECGHGYLTKKDIQAKIDAGIYKLANLNK